LDTRPHCAVVKPAQKPVVNKTNKTIEEKDAEINRLKSEYEEYEKGMLEQFSEFEDEIDRLKSLMRLTFQVSSVTNVKLFAQANTNSKSTLTCMTLSEESKPGRRGNAVDVLLERPGGGPIHR
jgi:predicted RNase H-like nuclease (RuvC/YqgF family)